MSVAARRSLVVLEYRSEFPALFQVILLSVELLAATLRSLGAALTSLTSHSDPIRSWATDTPPTPSALNFTLTRAALLPGDREWLHTWLNTATVSPNVHHCPPSSLSDRPWHAAAPPPPTSLRSDRTTSNLWCTTSSW